MEIPEIPEVPGVSEAVNAPDVIEVLEAPKRRPIGSFQARRSQNPWNGIDSDSETEADGGETEQEAVSEPTRYPTPVSNPLGPGDISRSTRYPVL